MNVESFDKDMPGVDEPGYFFTTGETTIVVGAYTGAVSGGAAQAAAA